MKLSLSLTLAFLAGSSAFAPRSYSARPSAALSMAEKKVPFFATGDASSETSSKKELTLEEEIEELTQAEMNKMRRASKLKTANGVDYAPWMNISTEDEEKIRQVMKEKAEARRKRQLQEQTVSGALLMDSQAQELSGGGLRTKVIEGQVELEWATNSEANTKGFLIKRRPARTEGFQVIASYEDWGPLASKGPEGGAYRYLDTNVSPGGWVYRITECEKNGRENDICQALVEVQTEEEQKGAVIAAVSIAVLGIAAVAAGILLDPVGGF
mmetsp:Transcript_6032/g.16893  ORF Transcript_6032/g.16893 Transcript_6032/m.16893 type:complete len:270 (-) Transcript_6032:23-832(-)